jgi:hypothetical protein
LENFQQYLLDTLEPDAKAKALKNQEKHRRFQGLACTRIGDHMRWVRSN